jgi:hypothetical protein
MAPKGLELFLKARIAGRLLSKEVILYVGPAPSSQWARYTEIGLIPVGQVTRRDDLRLLLGLDVQIIAPAYTDEVAAIYTKAKQYARSIILAIPTIGDGLVWVKGGEDKSL